MNAPAFFRQRCIVAGGDAEMCPHKDKSKTAGAPRSAWQSKDSPPPDGVSVLVRWPDMNPEADVPWRYGVGRYESKRALHHWWSATSSLPHSFVVAPSHWQFIQE